MLVVSPTWPALEGEKLLLASVIRRAAYDIAEYRGSTRLEHQKIWRDAYDWMFREPVRYEDPDDELMSFQSICEILQTSPNYIRAVTRLMSKKDIKRFQMVERNLVPRFEEILEKASDEEDLDRRVEKFCERIQRR